MLHSPGDRTRGEAASISQIVATSTVSSTCSREPRRCPQNDLEINQAVRDLASTPTEQHMIPAAVVESLYRHVDDMRVAFFGGELPAIVLSFEVRNRRNLGQFQRRNSLGLRWNVNLNPIHFAQPLCHILATLLHELAHAWQSERGTAGKPPYHNREFIDLCGRFGIPTDSKGQHLGMPNGSPLHDYCVAHGVDFPGAAPVPLLHEPPVRPKGSRLRKWICSCDDPVPVRVARADLSCTCDRCGQPFRMVEGPIHG